MVRFKIKKLILLLAITILLPIAFSSTTSAACSSQACSVVCKDGYTATAGKDAQSQAQACSADGGVDTTKPATDASLKSTGTNTTDPAGRYQCGGDDANPVHTSIDIGCKGHDAPATLNPIIDMTFALIRFLSYGVGLILVGSFIVAGIQYTTSQGDPKATAAAINRIRATIFALLIFIFSYAILNYIIPVGLFNIK